MHSFLVTPGARSLVFFDSFLLLILLHHPLPLYSFISISHPSFFSFLVLQSFNKNFPLLDSFKRSRVSPASKESSDGRRGGSRLTLGSCTDSESEVVSERGSKSVNWRELQVTSRLVSYLTTADSHLTFFFYSFSREKRLRVKTRQSTIESENERRKEFSLPERSFLCVPLIRFGVAVVIVFSLNQEQVRAIRSLVAGVLVAIRTSRGCDLGAEQYVPLSR